MNALRFAKAAEYTQTLALPACILAVLGVSGLAGMDNSGARPVLERVAPALAANTEAARTESTKTVLASASVAFASAPRAVANDTLTVAALPKRDSLATEAPDTFELAIPLNEPAT